MKIILSVLIAALILAYYLRSDWANIKNNQILLGALIGGTLIYYAGLTLSVINPVFASTLELIGASIFFTGVALNSLKRPQKNNPDQKLDQDEDHQ